MKKYIRYLILVLIFVLTALSIVLFVSKAIVPKGYKWNNTLHSTPSNVQKEVPHNETYDQLLIEILKNLTEE